jgi:periplasmic copper chaperone A
MMSAITVLLTTNTLRLHEEAVSEDGVGAALAALPKAGPGARPVRKTKLPLVALCGALAISQPARAAEAGLALADPWFRLVMPSLPAAGYFTLSNADGAARTLIGAASPACGMLMLHRSVDQGGRESMAMVDRVPVPAHGKLGFAPGGYHLMCTSPTAAMRPGHSVPVTLHFADGSSLTASFPVRDATGH